MIHYEQRLCLPCNYTLAHEYISDDEQDPLASNRRASLKKFKRTIAVTVEVPLFIDDSKTVRIMVLCESPGEQKSKIVEGGIQAGPLDHWDGTRFATSDGMLSLQ